MEKVRVLLFLLVSLLTKGVSAQLVPLLAWSNRNTFSSVTLEGSDGNRKIDISSLVEQSAFQGLSFVFVFRTDKMTFDDIAKYGGVYDTKSSSLPNIQSEMASSTSVLWGGVEGTVVASQLVHGIAKKLTTTPKYITGMEDVAVVFGQSQLLVVDLPFSGGEAEFAQQDAMVAEVMEAVHHLDASFTAFYTAMTTEEDIESIAYIAPILAKREAPTVTTTSGSCEVSYIVNNDAGSYCALFCLTNSTILYWESQSDLEKGYSPCIATITAFDESSTSGCNSSTVGSFPSIFATVEGSCENSSDSEFEQEVEFTFLQGYFESPGKVPLMTGFWEMMIIAGPHTLSRYGQEKLAYPFSVPVGVSYSCRTGAISTTPIISNPNRFVQFGNESVPGPDDNVAELDEGGPVVQFIGLHIQAYGAAYTHNDMAVFSPVWDCHGTFTLPSLMGVFGSVILLIVLYLAIVGMFSIETVDRFEDPRAPSIRIENLH